MKTLRIEQPVKLGLLIAAVVCLIAASASEAQDRTGDTIQLQELVQSYDAKANKLQETIATSEEASKELIDQKTALTKQFQAEKNPDQRKHIQSVFYELRSKQNQLDRQRIKFVSGSIMEMMDDLERMKEVLGNSDRNPEILKERRQRLQKIVNSTGMIAGRLNKDLKGLQVERNLQHIEQMQVMYFQQLESPNSSISGAASGAHLDDTIQIMENYAVQLQLFSEVLEFERMALEQYGPAIVLEGIMADIVPGGRLSNGIRSALNDLWEDITTRNSQDADILGQPIYSTGTNNQPTSERYQGTLYKLRNGIPPQAPSN